MTTESSEWRTYQRIRSCYPYTRTTVKVSVAETA